MGAFADLRLKVEGMGAEDLGLRFRVAGGFGLRVTFPRFRVLMKASNPNSTRSIGRKAAKP